MSLKGQKWLYNIYIFLVRFQQTFWVKKLITVIRVQ